MRNRSASRRRKPLHAVRSAAVRAMWLLPVAAGAYAMLHAPASRVEPVLAANDLGTPVEAPEEIAVSPGQPGLQPIGYVENCVWSNPGADPWRGDDLTAIMRAGIPEAYARQIVARIRAGDRTGTISFSRQTIVSNAGLVFAPRFSMTFANSLCRNSRVGFGAGRVEQGDLYSVGGYHVAIPYVCGNVTRVYPSMVAAMPLTAPMVSESASPAPMLPEVTPAPPEGNRLPDGPGGPVSLPLGGGSAAPTAQSGGPYAFGEPSYAPAVDKSSAAPLASGLPMSMPFMPFLPLLPTSTLTEPSLPAPVPLPADGAVAPTPPAPDGATAVPGAPGVPAPEPTVPAPGVPTSPLQPGTPETMPPSVGPAPTPSEPVPVPILATLPCVGIGLAAMIAVRRRQAGHRAR